MWVFEVKTGIVVLGWAVWAKQARKKRAKMLKNEQKEVGNLQKRATFGAEIGKKRCFLSIF